MLSIKNLKVNNLTKSAVCAVEYNNKNVLSVVSVHLPSTGDKSVKKTPSLLKNIYELSDGVILLGDINASISYNFNDETKTSTLEFYDKTKDHSMSTQFLTYTFPNTNIVCDKNAKSMNVKTRLVSSQCSKGGVESGGFGASDNCILFDRKSELPVTCEYSSAFKANEPLTKLTYGSNEVPSDHAVASIVYSIKRPEQIWINNYNVSMKCMTMNVGGNVSNDASYNLEYIPVGYDFKDDEEKTKVLSVIKASYAKIIDYEKEKAKLGIANISVPSRLCGIFDIHIPNVSDLIDFFKENNYSSDIEQCVYKYTDDQQVKYDQVREQFLTDYPNRLENLILLEEAFINIKQTKELQPIRLAAIKSFVDSLVCDVHKMTQLEFIKSHIESNDYSIVSLQEVPLVILDSVKELLESHGFTVPDWHIEDNFITFVAINTTNIEPFIKEMYEYSHATI
jgi:hypothetical protein